MARITVERSAIGDFLDELPGLIMQYKQMQWAQEERALEREERKADTALLPKVTSLEAVAEVATASCPNEVLFEPVVVV